MLEVDLGLRLGGFALHAAFTAPLPGVTALFGPSGCGKTTVINLLAGLLRPDEGRIVLDGDVLSDATRFVPPERRRLGYVFQDGRLFPHLTVAGNLRYGARRNRQHGDGVTADLDMVVGLLGLGGLMDRRPHRLSGGERQRVALGRALLARPRLLLLDEPLASLDAARREEVLPYLERLRDQLRVPMVLVSHQFDEVVRLATHVVLMENGGTVGQGSLTEVATLPALRRLVGTEAVGAVLEGTVEAVDAAAGLTRVRVAGHALSLAGASASAGPGSAVRIQVLARDVILALEKPAGLSVRNALPAVVSAITPEATGADLVELAIGDRRLLARITRSATAELELSPGQSVWALVKAASLRSPAGV
jgi:molybdate transport system ATP-binding protein